MRYTGTRGDRETRRDSKGWEWEIDPRTGDTRMAEDSAGLMREQAGELRRETRGALSRDAATDKSRKMGNPATHYAKGGVTRGDGCVTKGHTKGKMR